MCAFPRSAAADFLSQHKRLNYLSENAGMGPTKYGWKGPWASPQGFEYLYASNYLGHFLLLNLLLPLLKDSTDPRVAATSSIAHWVHSSNLTSLLPSEQIGSSEHFGHLQSWRQYGNTKLLQILMCFELQRRLAPTGGKITATPVAPGYISTAISKPVTPEP